MAEVTISFRDLDEERALFGHLDKNLRALRLAYDVDAVSRGGRLTLSGDPQKIDVAAQRVEQALRMIRDNQLTAHEIGDFFTRDVAKEKEPRDRGPGSIQSVARPRTRNQQSYMELIRTHAVTFGVGPAGSGKTYLAVAMAVTLLKSGDYRKIVLTRPAVEAGELLGFLPGDLEAKIDPYLRPLYDALDELLPRGSCRRYMEEGVVEVCPLAYMRGRTLNNSVIILDEAQNTTPAQMKMFLTRMGMDSKMIVTGDVTQIDLPNPRQSGLVHGLHVLQKVDGIAFCHFDREDIVRHPVVQNIVQAYSSFEEHQRQIEAAERKKRGEDDHDRGDRRPNGGKGSRA